MSLSRRLDQGVAGLAWGGALLIAGVFVWLASDLVLQGWRELDWAFVTEAPREAGRAGGIGPLLVSTGAILAVCLAAAVPLGLATAVALNEYLPAHGRAARWLGRSLDVLNAVPSIVFGLFGYAVFAQWLGLGFSILSGGLTLACMVLPLFVRIVQQSLAGVTRQHRPAAEALAVSQTGWILRLLVPGALPGITAGLILGIGRALAETAALVFTAGYVMRLPGSVFDSGRALSVHIYDLSMNVAGGNAHAAATALVLFMLLLSINAAAGRLNRRWQRMNAV